MSPWVDLIKLFWRKFTYSFCKLYYFIKISYICCISMKRSSLQKWVSKFMPKEFYEIDPLTKFTPKFFYDIGPEHVSLPICRMGAMTLCIMAFSFTTLSKMTFSRTINKIWYSAQMTFSMTIKCDTQHNDMQYDNC
jgi:hypothetical protein